jgi:tRNA pseudouridine-54 N-methylase
MFNEFPIERSSVKSGQNGPEVIIACRCVNVGLFISGDLRRDVIVSLAIGKKEDLKVISFPGESLKRVSPDERSISFFLLKAIEKGSSLEFGDSLTMDNGIKLIRSSLDNLIELWDSTIVQVPSSNPERFILEANLSNDKLENTP